MNYLRTLRPHLPRRNGTYGQYTTINDGNSDASPNDGTDTVTLLNPDILATPSDYTNWPVETGNRITNLPEVF
jgi:hypothetical protein